MIIDFNAYVGHWWPGGEAAAGEPEVVRHSLAAIGIEAAFVSLLEAPWYRDQQAGSRSLLQLLAPHRDFFLPLACLDPTTNYWRADLERLLDEQNLAGVRLHPAHHHYFLDEAVVIDLAREVGRTGLPLFVTLMIEEDRFAHPALKLKPLSRSTSTSPIPSTPGEVMVIATGLSERPLPALMTLLQQAPETTFVITQATVEEAFSILRQPEMVGDRIFFDIGRMDKPTLGLDYLVEAVGAEQLLLGTNAPIFYPAGALLCLAYRRFADALVEKILHQNYLASPVLRAVTCKLQTTSL